MNPNFHRVFFLAILLLSSTSCIRAETPFEAEAEMEFPQDANGDVLRRMQNSNFDFSKAHDVEFFAVFRTEAEAKIVANQYLADHKTGHKLVNIETRPAESGGMELVLVKNMLLTHSNVTAFESSLQKRVSEYDGYLDGWGVLQE